MQQPVIMTTKKLLPPNYKPPTTSTAKPPPVDPNIPACIVNCTTSTNCTFYCINGTTQCTNNSMIYTCTRWVNTTQPKNSTDKNPPSNSTIPSNNTQSNVSNSRWISWLYPTANPPTDQNTELKPVPISKLKTVKDAPQKDNTLHKRSRQKIQPT